AIDDDALGSETLSLSGSDAAQFEIVGTDLRLRSGVTLDFEDDDSLDVSVSVDDATVGATPDDTQAFSLSVTDANDAPSITLTTVVGSLAENADTSSAITVATIMVVDDGLGSETLSLSGSDAAAFEIVGNDLRLRSGATLDFEDDDSLDVSVSVDDVTVGSTPDDTQAFSLSVTDVNEAPTITITTVVGTLAENADTSSAITVATIAIGDDALGSETLSLSGSDAASFELVGNQLRVRAGATLDFEDDDSLDVSVSVDDPTVGSTPDDTQAFSVSVTDVNEAPSITLTPVQTTLGEDEDTSASIVVATLSIHDDALGSESLTLSGFDASLFEIDGNRLQLRAGTVLDATLNSSLDVTVNVDDATVGGTPDDSEAFTVTVTQGNSDPTGQPQIVGTLRVGETLQAETGSIQDADGLGAFDYQWQRDGVDIVGANQHDYTLTDADEDAQIQVAIRFIDGRGTSEGPLISLASDAVAGRLVLPPPATNAGADSGGETQSETTESNESSSSSEDSSSSESSEESGESDSGDSESAGEASDSNLAAKVVKQELGQRLNPSGSEAETGQLDVEAVVTADPIQQEWQRVAGSSAQADSTWQSIQRATTVVSQVSNLLDLNVAIDLTRVLSPQEVAMFVEPGKLWNALDQNQQVIQDTIRGDLVVVGTAGAAASSLTVGAVAWTLRSGVLLSGFLAQLPAWRAVDPLLVMQGLSSNGADNETLEELMQRRNEGFGHDETHDSSSDEIASLTTESDVDTRSRETNPEGFETKAQL
ncbi:MAG: cadherin domain protein, partial [Planctomycetota bacterium]